MTVHGWYGDDHARIAADMAALNAGGTLTVEGVAVPYADDIARLEVSDQSSPTTAWTWSMVRAAPLDGEQSFAVESGTDRPVIVGELQVSLWIERASQEGAFWQEFLTALLAGLAAASVAPVTYNTGQAQAELQTFDEASFDRWVVAVPFLGGVS